MTNIKNHVQLVGRLGANPEMKTLDNGNKMTRFALAVSETYYNKAGEKVTDVQWHSVIAWNSLAELASRTLYKGVLVTVDGKLQKRSYTTREGVQCSVTEIIAGELLVMEKKAA